MTDQERADIDMNGQEHYNRVWGSKIQVIGWSFYACILWCLKFCVTAFYGRLTYVFFWRLVVRMFADLGRSGLTHLKTRVTIAYIILGVSYAVVALTILLSCQPFHHFWQVSPDPGLLCQPTKSPAYVLVVVIPNILTDIYLLSIPLPVSHLLYAVMFKSDRLQLLWGVNISLRRRLTLMLLFSGALFIMMAGTIRAVTILTVS